MLKLSLKSEPSWLDLGHGVRLFVEPLSSAMMLAARSDPAVRALAGAPAQDDEDVVQDEAVAVVVAKALARLVVKDWEGVGDEAGEPIALTPEGLDALLDIWPLFEAFQTRYVAGAMLLDAEKNG
ncbi:hypothetical protein MED193_12543 [Roseobacter sp. MED193]|uniref:hypothetical protein n=1 Tax=Roseobacter sp. MED193 TaxID=314262 RepID=UPI000068E406|nr:hypothetical protein [Roseobacter sp. MED193]EAQ43698.1 hypothetical protein MED193_12543 [Roseobacter sp. MED193]